jgi:hypothetical protein
MIKNRRLLYTIATTLVFIFFLLPVSSQKIYKCPKPYESCPDVVSSGVNQSLAKSLVPVLKGDHTIGSEFWQDLTRNSIILIPALISLIYAIKKEV